MASRKHQKAMDYIYQRTPFTELGTCVHCEYYVNGSCTYEDYCAVGEEDACLRMVQNTIIGS